MIFDVEIAWNMYIELVDQRRRLAVVPMALRCCSIPALARRGSDSSHYVRRQGGANIRDESPVQGAMGSFPRPPGQRFGEADAAADTDPGAGRLPCHVRVALILHPGVLAFCGQRVATM